MPLNRYWLFLLCIGIFIGTAVLYQYGQHWALWPGVLAAA